MGSAKSSLLVGVNSQELWADHPLPLVETPKYTTGDHDVFTEGASQMAILHNAILRGFNTIYLQAPHVQPRDYRDFVGYSLVWCKFVKKHHDDEEAQLFPSVEAAMGVIGALDHSREEHHTFMHGLTKFNTYLASLYNSNRTAQFSGTKLISIMNSFKDAFCHHFHHEIGHIANLKDLATTVCPEDSTEVGAIFAAWGRKSMRNVGMSDVLPFMFMNHDRSMEEGMWKDWPAIPAPVRWLLVNLASARNSGFWKFASCTSDGRKKPLYALRESACAAWVNNPNNYNYNYNYNHNHDHNYNSSSSSSHNNNSSTRISSASSTVRSPRRFDNRPRSTLGNRRSSRKGEGSTVDLSSRDSGSLLIWPASAPDIKAS